MNGQLFPEIFQVAEIEISYRNTTPFNERILVNKSQSAYEILNASWDKDKIELVEQFKILLLNRQNHCLGIVNLSTGSSFGTPVDPRLVFAAALKANATALVLAHNHPTGNVSPTNDDIVTTKSLAKAAELFGIAIFDHLILSKDGFFSFGANGLLPKK
ncbi:JAB domain-containing protein [Emticicia sp. BO119]|nr:JAB domain-containing protein [Emticicia sp. BO119]